MNKNKPAAPWLLLFGRTALFVIIQAIFALAFSLTGTPDAWEKGASMWPFVVTITNIICVVAMMALFRAEGGRFWEIFRIRKGTFRKDILPLLGSLVIAGPLGYLPNVLLAGWLFEDALTPVNIMLMPMPLLAAYASIVLFPITQGLAEIPTYFSYVMPRLEAQGLRRWMAVGLPVVMLGLQHIAVPLLFNFPFIVWRAFMFMPFALLLGVIMRWRPRLLPYLAVTHVLIDAAFVVMLLNVAY